MKSTNEKVREIIVDILGAVTIDDDSRLADDLNFDSLDFVELAMEVEERFDISVDEDVVEKFETMTVSDLCHTLDRLAVMQAEQVEAGI